MQIRIALQSECPSCFYAYTIQKECYPSPISPTPPAKPPASTRATAKPMPLNPAGRGSLDARLMTPVLLAVVPASPTPELVLEGTWTAPLRSTVVSVPTLDRKSAFTRAAAARRQIVFA